MPPISQPILTASRLMVGTIEFGTTWRQNTMPSGMPRARAAVELVGQPVRLLDWQNMEILRIYDNPAITRKCFWTFGKFGSSRGSGEKQGIIDRMTWADTVSRRREKIDGEVAKAALQIPRGMRHRGGVNRNRQYPIRSSGITRAMRLECFAGSAYVQSQRLGQRAHGPVG